MKNSKLIIMGGSIGALIMSSAANATLLGLSVLLEPRGPGAPPTGGPRWILRVYANFSSSTDRVNAWGAGGDFGPGGIVNLNIFGAPGNGFTNIGGAGGQLAPYEPGTDRDWDTYMTIGVAYGMEAPGGLDATTQIPGTPEFITNGATSWTPDPVNGGGVFITPNDPQGAANYRVSGNDTDHRVLLMQMVINAGAECIWGTVGVVWQAAGQASVTTTGMTFNCFPSAGGLPLLACAGLLGTRRRRQP